MNRRPAVFTAYRTAFRMRAAGTICFLLQAFFNCFPGVAGQAALFEIAGKLFPAAHRCKYNTRMASISQTAVVLAK